MIVYTPLDIKLKLPAYNKVLKYVKENYVEGLDSHTGYTSRLCPIATPFPVVNWRSAPDVFIDCELDNFKELNFAPNVLEIFPEIEEIFKALPYDTLYGAMFNWHMEPLVAHRDSLIDQDPPELERINVLISPHHNQKSFFLQPTLTSEPIYPTILEEYPFYAFNDTKIYHGADPVLDDRIIIVFVGILNKDKYKELIDRSVKKFKDYVIQY